MTKEELQRENITLNIEKLEAQNELKTMREELSKILGAGYKPKSQYNLDEGEQIIWSWMEIAKEIGVLKATQKTMHVEKMVRELRDIQHAEYRKIEQKFKELEK